VLKGAEFILILFSLLCLDMKGVDFVWVFCHLSGVMVSVCAIGFRGSWVPGRGEGFLRAIKIHRTLSFRGEVKPEAPCC
jgi:hypothetical protein